MIDSNNISYFGKLRRQREFIKSTGLCLEFQTLWETWLGKCTRKNSFLPFLANRHGNEKSVWLFILNDNNNLKIGMTTMSSDKADRDFPFVLFIEPFDIDINKSDWVDQGIGFLTERIEKFKRFISIGTISAEDIEFFVSTYENNTVNRAVIEIFHTYGLYDSHSKEESLDIETPSLQSIWVNLNNLKNLQHVGALTCTLHNKIYG